MGCKRVLRLLSVDIIREQFQEIGFMEELIARYPGDAPAVQPIMPRSGCRRSLASVIAEGSLTAADLTLVLNNRSLKTSLL